MTATAARPAERRRRRWRVCITLYLLIAFGGRTVAPRSTTADRRRGPADRLVYGHVTRDAIPYRSRTCQTSDEGCTSGPSARHCERRPATSEGGLIPTPVPPR